MKLWTALTPALSLRRRSAMSAACDVASVGAFVAFPNVERRALPGMRTSRVQAGHCPTLRSRGFTLIELVLVMAMLLIVLAVSFPSLRGFFRGRNLDSEARRFLSLTRYAQNRAVSEGYPMILWIDAKQRTYGMQAQTGYLDEDAKSVEYKIDETLELEVTRPILVRATSTQRNAASSVVGNLPSIRFTPDGFYADSSPEQIILRQDDKEEVVIARTGNRIGYEIQTSNQQSTRR